MKARIWSFARRSALAQRLINDDCQRLAVPPTVNRLFHR